MIENSEIYKRKIDICKNCEHYIPTTKQCSICKCIMIFKARLKGNTCPLGKHDIVNKTEL